ncbi:sister chromatid cohesion protein 1 [Allomyces javanicus]|nr:sister chromatid cohesion protein 1 [Allomyces javanicus]
MPLADVALHRRGPLAKVWLAAHYDKKLSKKDIVHASIPKSVAAIQADAALPAAALRLTGQLLVGVVRIYSRKAKYLLDECHDAKLAIQLAFKPGAVNVDLPADQHRAAQQNITLADDAAGLLSVDLLAPPPLDDLAAEWGGLGALRDAPPTPTISQARRQDITLADAFLLAPSPRKQQAASASLSLSDAAATASSTSAAARLAAAAGAAGVNDIDMLDLGLELPPLDLDLGLDLGMAPPHLVPEVEAARRDETGDAMMLDLGLDLPPPPLLPIDDKDMIMDDNGIVPPPPPLPPQDLFAEDLEPFGLVPGTPAAATGAAADGAALAVDAPATPAALFADLDAPGADGENAEAAAAAAKPARKRRKMVLLDTEIAVPHGTVQAMQHDTSSIVMPSAIYVPASSAHAALLTTAHTKFAQLVATPLLDGLSDDLRDKCRIGMNADAAAAPKSTTELDRDVDIFDEIPPPPPMPPVDEDMYGAMMHDNDFLPPPPPPPPMPPVDEEMPLVDDAFQPMDDVLIGAQPAASSTTAPPPLPEDWADEHEPRPEEEEDEAAAVGGFSRASVCAIKDLRAQFTAKGATTAEDDAVLTSAEVFDGKPKREAARTFYELLLLGTRNVIKVQQEGAFGDVAVRARPALFELALS